MFFKKISLLSSLFLITFLFAEFKDKRLFIEITNPHIKKLPIAIVDFINTGKQTDPNLLQEIKDTLEFDLNVSGIFIIIPPKAFLSNTIDVKKFSPDDWKILGTSGVITTHYKIESNVLSIEFRLFDVNTGNLVVGKRYSGTKDQRRVMAHNFANELMDYYTGEPGVFNTKIAFASNKPGNKEIYIMDYDGKNIKQLTNNSSLSTFPSWSPDNENIAYIGYQNKNPDIWVINLKTNQQKKISSVRGLHTGPTWLPDGKNLIYASSSHNQTGDTDIFMINIASGRNKRLTFSRGIDISPNVSKDGKKIAFVSSRMGQPHIFTMNFDGSNVFRITYAGRYNATPSWLPRGDKIVFAGWNDGKFDLFIVNADATNMERLTNHSKSNEDPSLSADGRLIVFVSTRRTANSKNKKSDLYLINSNGLGERLLLADFGQITNPSWSNR